MAPIAKTSWAYPGDDELNAYEYDLDKANALLDEAGWVDSDNDGVREKDGEKLSLDWLVYTDSTWPGTLSGMAYDSWKQIGVELNIKQMDFNTVAATTMDAEPGEKDFDIYTMGFSLSIDPDPTGGLFDADAYSAGGFNASGFRDDRSQELIKLGLQEFDQEKRAEIYKEWAARQNELVPTLIVAYRSEIWGINNRVHGLDDIGVYTDFTQLISNVTLD
jgi:peptide/nickel transport system substrate-binding protein